MTNTFKLAAVQMISGADVDANLHEADRLIAEAAAQGAQCVALPEYFCLLSPDETAKVKLREPDGEGPLQAFLADAACRYKVWLVGGTIPLVANDDGRVRNTTLVFNPEGVRVARYDKIHLFGFTRGEESYNESRTIEAGHDAVTFDAPWGKTGLVICYDLRFPELFRQLGEVNLIILPAAFTETTGRAHWEVLLRARAIENQCYVLASAQGGTHPHGRRTFGHSMLIDPWGEIVAHYDSGPGVAVGTLDLQRIHDIRESLPALKHRKFV
ncbi:carbon-nitrogen hydrolase family protein [Uliginosibacterium sp. H3]|uniref:Carbon-nitrogen hydrolase family protein n=1 Tax=Uliginosibacterium silvisoli TaxID=3114758 RepID=A0ABU6K1Y6_9RHOO|nr:carbon-nitrogen hydrolase family protein [Uliginosibacterium sp. H3]